MFAEKRILVVEDEPMIALDMEQTLSQLGHVDTAETIAEAVGAITEAKVDLVVMDFQLRDGIAYPLAVELSNRKIPFVICSGSPGLEEFGQVFRDAPLVPKPYTTDCLLAAVRKAAVHSR